MKNICFWLLALTLYFIGTGISLGQQTSEKNYRAQSILITYLQVESINKKVISYSTFQGIVLLATKNVTTVDEKAHGNFTYDYVCRELSTDTIFDLASVSKLKNRIDN